MKRSTSVILLLAALAGALNAKECSNNKKSQTKLICYYSKLIEIDSCKCSHVVLPANSDIKSIDRVREYAKGVKILITVNEFNQGLVDILKSSKVDGIEINLKKLDSKNDINDFISTVRSKLGSDLSIVLAVPSKPELLAKFYDFKALSKQTDFFILETAFLGASTNVTFHPSRLSGLWDMQNTDSVVDLVSGLGAPLSKIVISAPVQAFQFRLQSEQHTAPGSPALEVRSITRSELCQAMQSGNWTLERDQDQAGPYIFSKDQWIAFDDATSIDIKAKYARVRGLSGLALKDLSQDDGNKCEPSTILDAAFAGLSRQARAPRGAVLHSLEREILETSPRPLDKIQVSPYRISRVIDVEGNVHVIRQDTRTEFECSRQGYFVHPRSCGRFYRCVKFDQLSDEFSVFEFDCPAGLAFDNRVEVCVWPGSLPDASACSGSSEIAPVPRERFICPSEPGYYADPENCRWFFACLDHGKSPLSAYEFRCPFGLVYDQEHLLCEWPWLVPRCGSGLAVGSEVVYGGSGIVSLDQYNGLGVLGATTLGGLHGPLEQPIAKVYSSVGTISPADSTAHANLNGINLGQQEFGYNVDGVSGVGIGGYGTRSGLSLKAASTLQNAGLLRGDLNAGNYLQGGLGYAGNLNYGGTAAAGQYAASNIGAYSNQLQSAFNSDALANSAYYQNQGNNLYYQTGTLGSLENAHGASLGVVGTANGYATGAANLNLGSSLRGSSSHGQILGYSNGASQLGASLGDSSSHGQILGYSSGASQLGTSLDDSSSHGQILGYSSGASQLGASLDDSSSHGQILGYSTGASQLGASLDSSSHGQVLGYATGTSHLGASLGDSSSHGQVLGYAAGAANLHQGASLTDSSAQAHLVNGLAYNGGYGAKSEQSFTQYHSGKDSLLNTNANSASGTAGNINIVGAGYSAGYDNSSGIQVSSNGEENLSAYVTPSPISISTITSIPVVASVPVPALKVASGFETYNGGVVANVPELQYKLQSNLNSGLRGTSVVPKASTAFLNLVSSTPSSLSAVSGGYDYPKPSVTFVEEPVKSTVYQTKPISSTSFVQEHVQPIVSTYQKPAVIVSSTQTPLVNVQPAVISTYNVHSTQNTVLTNGYNYPKPTIRFEETPKVASVAPVSYQKLDNVHQGYSYEKPAVAFEEVPLKTVQPAVVNTYSYSSPSTVKPLTVQQTYVQKPVLHVQPTVSTVVQQPLVHVQQQPAVSVSTFQKHESFQGYDYPKPVVAFEERPQVQITSYNVPSTTIKPVVLEHKPQIYVSSTPAPIVQQKIVQVQQPAVSYSQGYHYEKPTVAFEEKPVAVTYQQPKIVQPISTYTYQAPVTAKPAVSTYTFKNVVQQSLGYSYPKPSVRYEQTPVAVNYQKPAVVSSYSYAAPSTVKPAVISTYSVPSVTLQKQVPIVQQPVVSSYSYSAPVQHAVTVQKQVPIVQQQNVLVQKPAVISSYSYTAPSTVKPAVEFTGYDYPKPSVQFVEQPAPVVSYSAPATVKPAVLLQKQPAVVSTYSYSAPSTVKPAVVVQQQPAVISTYSYTSPSTVKPAVLVQKQPVYSTFTYTTPKPEILIQKQPVATYSYSAPVQQTYTVQKQVPVVQQESVLVQKPAAVSSYSYTAPSTVKPAIVEKTVEFTGYDYPKPSVQFVEQPAPAVVTYENRQPIQEVPFVAKKAYVTGGQSSSYYTQNTNLGAKVELEQNYLPVQEQIIVPTTTPRYEVKQQQVYSQVNTGYVYEKPRVRFEEKPVVIENYQAPAQEEINLINYNKVQKVLLASTPRPTFATAVNTVIAAKAQPQEQFYLYENTLSSTPRPFVKIAPALPVVETVSTSRPIVRYSFSSIDDQYQYQAPVQEYVPVKVTTEAPQREYLPVRVTTELPIREYLPVKTRVRVTTPTPIVISEVPVPTREYLPVRQRVRVTTPVSVVLEEVPVPTREYLPVRTRVRVTTPRPTVAYEVPTREYLPVRTRVKVTTPQPTEAYIVPEVTSPTREYLPVTKKLRVKVTTSEPTEAYEVTTPSREYLPVRSRVRVTTVPSREYLPSAEENYVATRRPVKVVKVIRPKTIVKQNDFHPLLAAKLGAQCTCVSNTVKLRNKKPLQIVVEDNDDNDDDDGYVVGPDGDSDDVVVENYEYESQKVVDITPTPQVVIQSTTNLVETAAAPVYAIKKRVRVRPTYSSDLYESSPVTEAIELFVKKSSPTTEGPSDREIAKAVRTGLKLVKQAAKEGAKEGAEEALSSKDFDRYGPGGVRSRSERLQGTVDCQRAGLFRHPTQCNKFYACRWDCTKNKYTLHVFNCPIHLTFDNNLGACNWPSQGPACLENTLLPSE